MSTIQETDSTNLTNLTGVFISVVIFPYLNEIFPEMHFYAMIECLTIMILGLIL
jgi:hypothetical protein